MMLIEHIEEHIMIFDIIMCSSMRSISFIKRVDWLIDIDEWGLGNSWISWYNVYDSDIRTQAMMMSKRAKSIPKSIAHTKYVFIAIFVCDGDIS